MKSAPIQSGKDIAKHHGIPLSKRSLALIKVLEAQHGAYPKPMTPSRATAPNILLYKVMDKLFAVLHIRGTEKIVFKCDPDQVLFLREHYQGTGQHSVLDARYWISVSHETDLSMKEMKQLVEQSYALVCQNLTKKQQAELAGLDK